MRVLAGDNSTAKEILTDVSHGLFSVTGDEYDALQAVVISYSREADLRRQYIGLFFAVQKRFNLRKDH